MKYAFSRLLLIFLLCFVAQTSLRAALAVQPLQLRTATDAVLSVGDSLPRKDTLTTAEAAMKARFDSLENRLAPRVDTTSLLQNNRKTTATTTAAQQDLQRQLKKTFVPNPQRALWLSLVYGGFLGCTYAFLWNQQMYMDYSQAYLDIMDDDPLTNSFRNLFPPTYDIDSRLEQFKTVFRNRKDRFRRYRDLSVICFVGVYLLSALDAYVDAQLSVFDISPDLSLQFNPASIETNNGLQRNHSMGFGATLTF